MEIDGGGWLVFQYRHNGEVDFQRNWQEYKQGFGSLDNEFWLGNDFLNYFTTQFDHEVYIKGERFNGEITFSKYSEFKIDNEEEKYRIYVSGENGTPSLGEYNNMLFSTPDQDNDLRSSGACSEVKSGRGGFWFKSCGQFFPNAFYYSHEIVQLFHGMQWIPWFTAPSGSSGSVKGTEMLIRRK